MDKLFFAVDFGEETSVALATGTAAACRSSDLMISVTLKLSSTAMTSSIVTKASTKELVGRNASSVRGLSIAEAWLRLRLIDCCYLYCNNGLLSLDFESRVIKKKRREGIVQRGLYDPVRMHAYLRHADCNEAVSMHEPLLFWRCHSLEAKIVVQNLPILASTSLQLCQSVIHEEERVVRTPIGAGA